MNILIIDDDSICSFINTRIVQKSGLFGNIRSVHTGQDALDVLAKAFLNSEPYPDVILLDLNMPLMDGFDFVRSMRQLGLTAKKAPEIIIVTSSDNSLDLQRAEELEIHHYLQKPLTQNDFQNAIFSVTRKCGIGSAH